MTTKKSHHHKTIHVVTLLAIMLATSKVHAQEQLPSSKAFSDGTKEFLSDPARTGSLVGTILAGAALANPLAPLLGSVAGFIIGKNSAFTNTDSNDERRNAFNNRSLIPKDGLEITGLSGLKGNPSDRNETLVFAGLPGQAETANQLELDEPSFAPALPEEEWAENDSQRKDPIVIVESMGKTEASTQSEHNTPLVAVTLPNEPSMTNDLQKQLAASCGNVQPSQSMSLRCFYYAR